MKKLQLGKTATIFHLFMNTGAMKNERKIVLCSGSMLILNRLYVENIQYLITKICILILLVSRTRLQIWEFFSSICGLKLGHEERTFATNIQVAEYNNQNFGNTSNVIDPKQLIKISSDVTLNRSKFWFVFVRGRGMKRILAFEPCFHGGRR